MEFVAKSSNGSSSSSSPCAACKLLRRRCVENCIFSPHFPADEPLKFASVHRVFGASNVSKMLQEISVDQRGDAVSSMVYEANSRIRDPVYGCVGAIANLQRQVLQLQTQLAVSQAQTVYAQLQYELLTNNTTSDHNYLVQHHPSSSPTTTTTTTSHLTLTPTITSPKHNPQLQASSLQVHTPTQTISESRRLDHFNISE